MADRTVNININYKINTDDLNKAAGLSQKAQAATDALRGSSQKAGSTITQEFQKSNKTILEMQNALARLKSIIEITSNPQKLRQLSGEYKNLKKQLDDATKSAFGLDKAIKNQGGVIDGLSAKFGQLSNAVKTVLGAAIIKQVVNVGLELARLGGNAEGVQRAFERAFPNSFQLLKDLKEATHGTVTEVELMQRTLQATNLGVSVQQLPKLFEFAAARAQQTGESVDYLVDSIVRGIGRKSPLILDNLGISAIRLKEKFNGAALASQSVADVTKAVGEIAEEEMAKMGGVVLTASQSVDQLNVSWTELRTNLAKRIDSTGIIEFFRDAFEGASNALKTDKERREESAKMRASIEFASLAEHQLREERIENGKVVKTNQQDLVNAVQNEIRERMKLIEHSKVELEILKEKFDQASHTKNNTAAEINANIKIREQIVQQGLNVKANLKFYEETVKLLRAYFITLTKVETQEIITIKTLKDELKGLQEQREEATFIGDTAELDRLQREIILLEDRILKISDNIKWQKQWNREKEMQALLSLNAKKAEEELEAAIEAVSNKLGEAVRKAPEFEESLDEINEAIKETAETIKLTWGQEFLIRLRLAFQGKGGDTSEIQNAMNEAMRNLRDGVVNIAQDQANSLLEVELQNMQARLGALRDFYANQQSLAGDNERAKQELRIKEERDTAILQKKIFEKEKQVRKSQALIDGAAGIVKAFASYPYPAAIIISALIAAQTASQIAIINRQQPRFAKGVIGVQGKGTGTSDSIPAMISKGESVIRADRTAQSRNLLTAINEGKISDKEISADVLNKLHVTTEGVKYVGMDDTRIVNELRKQKPVDYMRHANILWEVKKSSDGLHTKIRRKSMG